MTETLAYQGDKPFHLKSHLSVGLVCAPFFSIECPSIQVGLLAAIARRIGAEADTLHLNLDLAKIVNPDRYKILCEHRGRMTGDWLFSIAAFGEHETSKDEIYFEAFADEIENLCKKLDCDKQYLSDLRHSILPAFIQRCVKDEHWHQYDVIGFTSTFQQNVASLALARQIKEIHPDVKVIFGGANFEDEMGPEYVRAFEFIDYAVIGEGEEAFPALLRSIANGSDTRDITGVVTRYADEVVSTGAAKAYQDLNAQPIPVYDEYFVRLEKLELNIHGEYGRLIPFEGSRGCWWGAKHHCTFCGLNGMGMGYRSKDPERLMSELTELSHRYRITSFEAVDNILDMRYINTLFTSIYDQKLDYTFFFEIKANLKKEQIKALQRGGVRWIQPGIESLSTHILQLMNKGCTMLQNVFLLKWARYYKIKVGWNIIWGFPGETDEDFEGQLRVAKLISHLEPPSGCGRIWLERFSPYFTKQTDYPVRNVRPESSYGYVYPPTVDLEKIAYFFEYEMDSTSDFDHKQLEVWIDNWRERFESAVKDSLQYRVIDGGILIDDDRGEERSGTYFFQDVLADMYRYCDDSIKSFNRVYAFLNEKYSDKNYSKHEIKTSLKEFCRLGLMISEDDNYLSLALPSNPNV